MNSLKHDAISTFKALIPIYQTANFFLAVQENFTSLPKFIMKNLKPESLNAN